MSASLSVPCKNASYNSLIPAIRPRNTTRRLLENAFPRHSERSEVRFSIARFLCDESLFDQNAKKREIPHFADSVRNDEFEVSQQARRAPSHSRINTKGPQYDNA